MKTQTFSVFHLFAGSGGGALGFQRATEEYLGFQGRFETLGGVDVDPEACMDFTRLVGVKASVLDLFNRDDYIAFHGHEPPEDWYEATPADLRQAAHNKVPDVIFLSPPCKGYSGLLPAAQAATEKYQALNRLTLRGIALALGAWADDLPSLIILENVPRIKSRGKEFLDAIRYLLRKAGYHVATTDHNLGEIGGLSQNRRRFLLVARNSAKVPAPLFHPPLRRVKSIGSALENLPLPDDSAAGPMHRLPRLQWLTWVRLALIPAGGDWRDLQTIEPEEYRIVPSSVYYDHSYGVKHWSDVSGTVTSGGSPSNGPISVADPRLGHAPRKGAYKVTRWGDVAATVIGSARYGGSSSSAAVADPRVNGALATNRPSRRSGQMSVRDWNMASSTVTGEDSVGSGALSVADPRLKMNHGTYFTGSPGLVEAMDWRQPGDAVTENQSVSGSNTTATEASPQISDPALIEPITDTYGYDDYYDPCCDGPRLKRNPARPGAYGVQNWDKPGATVRGATRTNNSVVAIADPRLATTPARSGGYGIESWDKPANTVRAVSRIMSGPSSVADPRVEPVAIATHDNQPVSSLPKPRETGVWLIVSEDGTWHRPLTTLELAVLQGFPTHMPDGEPLTLSGKAQDRWRERIGNAVPVPAAEAIARTMLLTLMTAQSNVFLMNLYNTSVWVRHLSDRVRVMNMSKTIVWMRHQADRLRQSRIWEP